MNFSQRRFRAAFAFLRPGESMIEQLRAIAETLASLAAQVSALAESIEPPKPVDCVLSDWSEWGPHPTDATLEIRTRTVVTEPANGGAACGPTEETRPVVVDPPEEPTDPELGVIRERRLNMTALLEFDAFNNQGRYSRWVPNITIDDLKSGLYVRANAHGIDDQPFRAPRYDLVLMESSGEVITVITSCELTQEQIDKRVTKLRFPKLTQAQIDPLPKGLYLLDIVPSKPTGETAVPCWINLLREEPQTFAVAQAGSFSFAHGGGPFARWVKLPMQIDPSVAYPLPPRQYVPMVGHPSPDQLYKRDLVPSINGDPPYLYTHETGLRTCSGPHGYAWSTVTDKLPRVVLRDGPRGIGTVVGATHLQFGRRGGVYGTDSWRMFHAFPDGSVKTLAGWRHGDNGLELVGDWSAIPAERHGFHEAWGMTWDLRTVSEETLDTSHPKIDRGDGTLEHPHTVGPVAFVADSQNNRIVRVQFSATSHDAEPVCTELLTGLADPWDVVYIGNGQIAVSERMSNRICAYDIDTGELAEVLVQGRALATVDKNRVVRVSASLEVLRAEPCVAPEGLFFVNGRLYFGSRAAQRVKYLDMATREIHTACDPWFDLSPNGSQFCKIAVRSDGTVFVCTWEVSAKGGPRAYKPDDGSEWKLISSGSTNVREGRGGKYTDCGYNTACAVDDDRITYSGADYGLCELSMALPDDPPAYDEDLYEQGWLEYEGAGYRLTHGVDGFGQFGYPLPWGKSEAMDYYLAAQGHAA